LELGTALGLIAGVLVVSALAAGLVERAPLSFPMLFLVLGFVVGVLLDFTAHQRLIRSSVRITARQELPEPEGLLLCLIGGFLALRNLQAEADGSAAAGGIVAAGS